MNEYDYQEVYKLLDKIDQLKVDIDFRKSITIFLFGIIFPAITLFLICSRDVSVQESLVWLLVIFGPLLLS